ncbi:MAG: DUF1186 domain-containing protein [Sulfuritalea sp.]|nr:DUF1186 domain-containing protein [Sulfuritalea sp.]
MQWAELRAALSRMAYPFPQAAAAEARARWAEFAPHFIAELERVAEGGSTLLDEATGECDGLFSFAAFLAAEQRDTRAYAPLLRAGHCSSERAEELFGDDVGEGLGRILASVCDGDLAPLRTLAEDRDAGLWCRYAALHAQVVRVVEGQAGRDEVFAYIEGLCERGADWLRRAGAEIDDDAAEFLSWAADVTCELGPAPLLEKIRGWIGEGLIEPTITGFDWFEQEAAKPVAQCLAEAAEHEGNRYVGDALGEIGSWYCYVEPAVREASRKPPPPAAAPVVRNTAKVDRNDPCPCGSGKKFKKCCGKDDGTAQADATQTKDGGVGRALEWLNARHGKAVKVAVTDMLDDDLDPDEQAALRECDDDDWQGIQINAMEWLLAEGSIAVKGVQRRVAELLLGPGGPAFTAGQRRWIEQLSRQPLRLYDIAEVIPGVGMRLCDALDTEAAPVMAYEKSGSADARVGRVIGARIMEVDGHHELSGAAYPFAPLMNASVLAELRDAAGEPALRREDLPRELSAIIRRTWIARYVRSMPLPTMVDAHSGELLLFVTDHYRVVDRQALAVALAEQPDVEATPGGGWLRLLDCDDGQQRQIMAIGAGKSADRIEVFYKTQQQADQGRPWFEALAGPAVAFAGRVLSDPKGLLRNMSPDDAKRPPAAAHDLPPDVVANAIEQVLRRSYANWSDEAIQALGGKTPRQAIKTPVGLERVKGLLRSYEEGEKEQAAQQGRREISYAFLWESVGLERAAG